MIDVRAALAYLDTLWTPEKGAFREALGMDKWWENDNYVASIVMQKYNPARYKEQKEGFLKEYLDTRWCILIDDTTDFRQAQDILPDWMRYADLVGLQYLYLNQTGQEGTDLLFGVLSKMRGLKHAGYIFDMATPKEGYTMYKLCLFCLCAVRHGHIDLAKELLATVETMQAPPGYISPLGYDETGGIRTEYLPPEWKDNYPQLLGLCNCETTSLAILAQDAVDASGASNTAAIGIGIGLGALGLYQMFKR